MSLVLDMGDLGDEYVIHGIELPVAAWSDDDEQDEDEPGRAGSDDILPPPSGAIEHEPLDLDAPLLAADNFFNIIGIPSYEKVICFLDYDGTLRDFENDPMAALPSDELRHLLKQMADLRDKLRCVIISGRDHNFLQDFLGMYPQITLVAEHGYQVRHPYQSDWRVRGTAAADAEEDWRDLVRDATKRVLPIDGSFVEEKSKSLVWHYRACDPFLGEEGAELLIEALNQAKFPRSQISRGHKMIEVFGPNSPTKGSCIVELLPQLLSEMGDSRVLVLSAGDDVTDETMFNVVKADLDLRADRVMAITSVKVGVGQTAARIRVGNPTLLRRLLSIMTQTLSR